METIRALDNQRNSRAEKKQEMSITKVLTWMLLSLGAIALLASIVYVSSILAFIGLGLVFWGAILVYIQPEQYTKKAILDATVLPSVNILNQVIQELNYKGKAIYLPPKYLKDPEASKVYISKQKNGKLPKPDLTLNHENDLFLENPNGILLTPPGAQLSRLFEKRLDISFAQTDLRYVTHNIPKLFTEDLEIAENIEIETENNEIKIRITDSAFKEAYKESNKLSNSYHSIGCPLLSAIACALTKATGEPVTIESIKSSENGKNIEAIYQILGKIETTTFLPKIKTEEITKKLLTQPIQHHLVKSLLPNSLSLLLTALGVSILALVAWITWNDISFWGKDIALIFFGSRTAEAISLGIGMKLIHYLLIALALVITGLLTYLRRRKV